MIFALVVLVLLGFSVLLNLGHLMRGLVPMSVARTHSTGPRLEEVVTEDNDASARSRSSRWMASSPARPLTRAASAWWT